MRLQSITTFLFTLLTFSLLGQNMADYTNNWEGKIENSKTFNFTVGYFGSICASDFGFIVPGISVQTVPLLPVW